MSGKNASGVFATLGDGGDADAGGVAGKDGLLVRNIRQLLEKTLFQSQVSGMDSTTRSALANC
jgi:hypothetical protein